MQICTRTQNVKCDLLFLQKLPKAPFRFVSTEMKSDNSGNVSGLQSAFNRTMTSYKCTMSHWCHTIVQWCHIDVSQLYDDVQLHSIEQWHHINVRHHPSTLKRKLMSHKCTLSHNYIQWEIEYCHTSSLKKTMVPNKSTFKKKIKSHISLQEDNYVT